MTNDVKKINQNSDIEELNKRLKLLKEHYPQAQATLDLLLDSATLLKVCEIEYADDSVKSFSEIYEYLDFLVVCFKINGFDIRLPKILK